jgi:hypothetical protein
MKLRIYVIIFAGITLMTESCKQEVVQVPEDEIVKLTIITDTTILKADGLSVINLKAEIPVNATDDFRKVTFLATPALGTFLSSTTGSNNVVMAGTDGVATASIKVSTMPGLYYIAAQVGTGAQVYKTDDQPVILKSFTFADKLSLSADIIQPIADGKTIVNISVSSKYELDKTIKLTANTGSFLQSPTPLQYMLPLDDKGNGVAPFQISNAVLPHIINASFTDNTSAIIIINPLPSRPDTIFAEPDGLTVDPAGAPVSIKTYTAKTDFGAKVSINTLVSYFAYKLSGSDKIPVGRFSGLSSTFTDASGAVPVVKFYGDTGNMSSGDVVYIEASAMKTATAKTVALVQLKVK